MSSHILMVKQHLVLPPPKASATSRLLLCGRLLPTAVHLHQAFCFLLLFLPFHNWSWFVSPHCANCLRYLCKTVSNLLRQASGRPQVPSAQTLVSQPFSSARFSSKDLAGVAFLYSVLMNKNQGSITLSNVTPSIPQTLRLRSATFFSLKMHLHWPSWFIICSENSNATRGEAGKGKKRESVSARHTACAAHSKPIYLQHYLQPFHLGVQRVMELFVWVRVLMAGMLLRWF